MSLNLDCLPSLVLSLIYDQIYLSSPNTLRCLLLVSRGCYHAAVPYVYRNLSLMVSSHKGLHEDCAELQENRLGSQFLVHVRCLKVWGYLPLLTEEDSPEFEEFPDYPEEWDPEHGHVFYGDRPDGSAEEVQEAWKPLVTIIQKSHHISDFIWICLNQLPPCLLKAVEQSHPTSRLHMRSFRLRSLCSDEDHGITDPHELDLIQSPNLHSISVRVTTSGIDGKPDYNKDAIFQVAAVAANLKHVNIVKTRPASSPEVMRYYMQGGSGSPQPWKGFVPPLEFSKKGELISLTYSGDPGVELGELLEWSHCIDLSKIRYLILGQVSDRQVINSVARTKFTSLEMLDVLPTDATASEIEHMMDCLPPLKDLRLVCNIPFSSMEKVLQRHGPTLRRMTIHHRMSLKQLKKVMCYCPFLEYLHMGIPNWVIASLNDNSLSDFSLSGFLPEFPQNHYLQVLSLSFTGIFSVPSDITSLHKMAPKIWDVINNDKSGFRLERLIVIGGHVSPPLPPFSFRHYY
ncbi:hypothetical protein BGW36DRAFT_375398 [Talaromyces proteolyticus]|uniref:Uncharacterized protein n=1 Tax=Talaromyces proteolyticus TaxID=1131652 RepID=A0AAD4Q343_9EURO|nr:uncharacterized protein BGW36DRAFT_375398 [Talaromyces proteolyticus]KAH8701018.1 hypothetical protein BGW36DRAFT_375398 [Talaromyces proteolyticus]